MTTAVYRYQRRGELEKPWRSHHENTPSGRESLLVGDTDSRENDKRKSTKEGGGRTHHDMQA